MKEMKRVYLDHAATTPVRAEVLQEMMPYFQEHFGNPSSFYHSGQAAGQALNAARESVAAVFNAAAGEIYFTSGGTESDNWAIKGAALAKKGRHIITSKVEHHAVLHTCEALARQGYDLTYLDVDADGLVDPEAVKAALRPDTILVSIMLANNEIGTIQPVAEIGRICREQKVLFHTDAVQAAGSIPIDVKAMNIDLMSVSAHKLYGPKGVGALYIRRGVRIANLFEGGAQEKRRRAGTENVAGIVGFAKALELASQEQAATAQKYSRMRDSFIQDVLDRIPHTRLNGHAQARLPNNINLSFSFIEGESILLLLDHFGFECSSGSACTSGSLDPSHVLLAIGLPHEIAHGSLRVTLGRSTRTEDLELLSDALVEIVQRLRAMSPLYTPEEAIK